MTFRFCVILLLLPMILGNVGCETVPSSSPYPSAQIKPKIVASTLAGAGILGLSAASFGAGLGNILLTTAGTVSGAYMGYLYGQELEAGDREKAAKAAWQARSLPVGNPATWQSVHNDISGSTTPILEGHDDQGDFCRQYRHILNIGGQSDTKYTTLCFHADGVWYPVR